MQNVTYKEYPVANPVKEKAYALVPHDKIPFTSAAVGITYPDPQYKINRPASAITLFEYVAEGEGEVMIGGEYRPASAGDFYILRAGEAHTYRASSANPWKKLWVNYVADYMTGFLDAYGVESGIYRSEAVGAYFEDLIELTKASNLSDKTCYKIADRIHKIIRVASAEKRNANDDEFGIRRLLCTYVHKKLNLDEFAELLHMSKSNVIRVFKKNYGVTPYEYLINLKIETSKILLRETELPIKDIADKLCISDEHYFSTVFLKKTGMRPRDFRKSENL